MAEQQRQSLCPRLIDYLAIVGARSSHLPRPSGNNNGATSSNTPPAVQVRILCDSITIHGRNNVHLSS